MTLQQIIELIGTNPKTILTYYLVVIALAIILALFVNKDNFKSPFTYIYSVLIYAVSIPAVVSVVLVIYGFFFRKIDFLQVDVLSYFLPIIALGIVFVIFNKTVGLAQIPGFKRVSGLFMMITLALFVAYVLQKTFFGIFFIGSFQTLLIIFLVVLVLIKIGWDRLVN
jgi:hypothetical protein